MSSPHWDTVWSQRHPDEVTWFQETPTVSLRLIENIADADAAIIDVGGGASRLVDHLLAAGYRDLTVLDISAASIDAARQRSGAANGAVNWIVADVTEVAFDRVFDVWHDRAAFHFLTDESDRRRYLAKLNGAVPVGGHVILSTFGPEGPEYCSGLPVQRYDIDSMTAALGDKYDLIEHELEQHIAPNGATQQFLYGVYRRRA
jgi:SAM-dependent methyltransferase